MARRDPMARIRNRPRPEEWADDETLTLAEAAALFFPEGPLTVSSLRTAARAGRLAIAKVAGKDLTSPRAVKALVKPCLAEKPNRPASGSAPTTEAGSSSIEAGKSAQAAAALKLKGLRAHSKPISVRGTNRPSAHVIPLRSLSQT